MDIKPFSPGDEAHILNLFEASFGKKMSPLFWNWRYQANPFTSDIMIHMMWDGDVLAGHYAVSPVEMLFEGKVEMTALSMTTMTHPAYSGRGIFSALAESLYADIRQNFNIDFVWGFPNNNSHYGFIKNLKWVDIATIPFLSLKLKDVNPKPSAEYKVVSSFNEVLVKKLNKDRASVQINRTDSFLKWRYLDNPVFQYHVLMLDNSSSAAAVFKVIHSFNTPNSFEVDVLEWAFEDAQEAKDLILSITDYCSSQGTIVSQINTWESVFSPRHIILEKNGFNLSGPVTFLGARELHGEKTLKYDFRRWDISMGYSDIF